MIKKFLKIQTENQLKNFLWTVITNLFWRRWKLFIFLLNAFYTESNPNMHKLSKASPKKGQFSWIFYKSLTISKIFGISSFEKLGLVFINICCVEFSFNHH